MLLWKDIIGFATKGNPTPDRRVEKSVAEWQACLSPKQFSITRNKGTEKPFSGESCNSHEAGKYACVGCHTELFDSTIKFESGSGWPSFSQPAKVNAIQYKKDSSFGMIRVEIKCNTCDAHLGHVFPDGPEPGGLRYCVNDAAIQLIS